MAETIYAASLCPTRNRPLDLLPLFAYLGVCDFSQRVENFALVSARPTSLPSMKG